MKIHSLKNVLVLFYLLPSPINKLFQSIEVKIVIKIQAAAGPPTALSLHKFQEAHFIILNLVLEFRSDKI